VLGVRVWECGAALGGDAALSAVRVGERGAALRAVVGWDVVRRWGCDAAPVVGECGLRGH